jgi:dCMP deaminase
MKQEKTIFIAGSREMSPKRVLDLFKRYSKKGKIIWGVYKEPFIKGFEEQPQFKTLNIEILNKFKTLLLKRDQTFDVRLEIIEYSQEDELEVINSLKIDKAIFINGSWKIVFHRRPIFELLKSKNIEFSLKSPFVDDAESLEYSKRIAESIEECIDALMHQCILTSDEDYLGLADIVAKRSFDYTWQTGAVLVRDGKVILTAHNRILPYENFAMHNGSLREKNMSALNDVANYDTIHAEMNMVIKALNEKVDIKGSTLYVNLMPCPSCARVLALSGIKKVVCRERHFGDYAEELFSDMGIEVIVLDNLKEKKV